MKKTSYIYGTAIAAAATFGISIATSNNSRMYEIEQKQAIDYEGANGYDVRLIKPSAHEIRILIGNLDITGRDFEGPVLRGIKQNNGQFRVANLLGLINAPSSLRVLCSPERLDEIARKLGF
ncbi:MAG: hypothetical protein Q8L34_01895 [Candidatus Woesearchaeota archaeon]|nr:hypothetical protein [Candidatus Woesearchaeota archaeon]